MSGGLEGIVRPFQTAEIAPPRSPLLGGLDSSTATANSPKNIIINPGKDGQVKTFTGSFSLTMTFYAVKKPKEKKGSGGGDGGISGGNPDPQAGNPPLP